MILQLNPAIPVTTPKGKGYAILVIDYSLEDSLFWTVFLDETGEIWTFRNELIRADMNYTLGRRLKEHPRRDKDE